MTILTPSSPGLLKYCSASSRSYFRLFGAIRFWRNSCKTHYIHIDYMVNILHVKVDTMLPFTLADNLAKAVKKPEVGHLGRSTSPWRGWLFYTLGEFLTVINVIAAFHSEVQINPWLEEPIKTNEFHTESLWNSMTVIKLLYSSTATINCHHECLSQRTLYTKGNFPSIFPSPVSSPPLSTQMRSSWCGRRNIRDCHTDKGTMPKMISFVYRYAFSQKSVLRCKMRLSIGSQPY